MKSRQNGTRARERKNEGGRVKRTLLSNTHTHDKRKREQHRQPISSRRVVGDALATRHVYSEMMHLHTVASLYGCTKRSKLDYNATDEGDGSNSRERTKNGSEELIIGHCLSSIGSCSYLRVNEMRRRSEAKKERKKNSMTCVEFRVWTFHGNRLGRAVGGRS